MGLDDLKNKAQEFLGNNSDKAEQGVDKTSEFAKDKFGHEEQIDQGAEKAKGFLGDQDSGGDNQR